MPGIAWMLTLEPAYGSKLLVENICVVPFEKHVSILVIATFIAIFYSIRVQRDSCNRIHQARRMLNSE